MASHLILKQRCFVVCVHVGIVIRIVCMLHGFHATLTSVSLAKLQRHLPGHYPATLRCERRPTTYWPENQTEQRGYRTGTQTLQMLQ